MKKTGLIIIALLIGAAAISIYEANSENRDPRLKTFFRDQAHGCEEPWPTPESLRQPAPGPRDVTSYELREPWDLSTDRAERPYLVWLPERDNQLVFLEKHDYPLAPLDQPYLMEIYQRYLTDVRNTQTFADWPEDLKILAVSKEDVHTNKHFNRTWILDFDEQILAIPDNQQQLFLTGLTKTLLEGNPVQRHQTNFTELKATSAGKEIGSYSVFHT